MVSPYGRNVNDHYADNLFTMCYVRLDCLVSSFYSESNAVVIDCVSDFVCSYCFAACSNVSARFSHPQLIKGRRSMSKSSVQEYSESASNYKEATLAKVLTKKRGRSCSKPRRLSLDARILRDQLLVSYANRELRKEMKSMDKSETSKDVVPESIALLRDNVKVAEANLVSARCAYDAMSKYPPLRKPIGVVETL